MGEIRISIPNENLEFPYQVCKISFNERLMNIACFCEVRMYN